MACKIAYKASVSKDLRRMDKPTARRVVDQLEEALGRDPAPGSPLAGEFRGLFKFRVGDYRVIYTRTAGGVLILRVAHRREAYR